MKLFANKLFLTAVLCLVMILCVMIVCACGDGQKDPDDQKPPVENPEPIEDEYELAYEKLSAYIVKHADESAETEQGGAYVIAGAYEDKDGAGRDCVLNLTYTNANAISFINVDWSVSGSTFEFDYISIILTEKKSDKVEGRWTDGLAGRVGLFSVRPDALYDNTNVEIARYVALEGEEISPDAHKADERRVTDELSAFLGKADSFLSREAGVGLKDLGFDKLGRRTEYAEVTDIIGGEEDVVSLKVGEKRALSFATYPYFVSDAGAYASSDSGVVKVSVDGVLTGVGFGSATVTFTAGGLSKRCSVEVRALSHASIAREFFEQNNGARFGADGERITEIELSEPFFELKCYTTDIGERMYGVKYYPNASPYERLDVTGFDMVFALEGDSDNIADHVAQCTGAISVCRTSGLPEYHTAAIYGFEFDEAGDVEFVAYMPDEFTLGLTAQELLRYTASMTKTANTCLDGFKKILRVNTDAYYDVSKTPYVTLTAEHTTTNSVKIAYKLSDYFDERIVSAEICGAGESRDCISELTGDGIIGDLLSDGEYTLVVRVSYNLRDGAGERVAEFSLDFRTLARPAPEFDVVVSASWQYADIDFHTINSTAYTVTRTELLCGGQVERELPAVAGAWRVDDLLSDTAYTIRVHYVYDLGDGAGKRNAQKDVDFSTAAYPDPEFDVQADVDYESLTFGAEAIVAEGMELSVVSVGLYDNGALVLDCGGELGGVLDALLANHAYELRIEYTFDKHDGRGDITQTYTRELHTLAYAEPSASVKLIGFDDDSVTFDVVTYDPHSRCRVTDIELTEKDGLMSSIANPTDLTSLTLGGLSADGTYEITVSVIYDLADGRGERVAEFSLTFSNSKFLYDVNDGDTVTLLGVNRLYKGDLTELTVPDTLFGRNAIVIKSLAFKDAANVRKVTLSDSVISAEFGALKGYVGLESITMPFLSGSRGAENGYIGYIFGEPIIFKNDSLPNSLKEVVLTDETRIVKDAFYLCQNLERIVIPNSVTHIEGYAFYGCDSIVDITLPFVGEKRDTNETRFSVFGHIFGYISVGYDDTIMQGYKEPSGIGYYYIPTSVRNVVITDQTVLPFGAFMRCDFIESITIPDSVEQISAAAFSTCKGLKRLNSETDGVFVLPESLTSIGEAAFLYCYDAVEVITGGNIREIGASAFSYCSGIIRFNGASDGELVVPEGVTTIGDYAFSYMLSITRIVLPDSVTSVGKGAFEGCPAVVE